MKKVLLGKNIKFALLLSISMAAGTQASQAAAVYCPTELDGMEKQGAYMWILTAHTTGEKEITLKGRARARPGDLPSLEVHNLDGASSDGDEIFCSYGAFEIVLKGNHKSCHAVDNQDHPVATGKLGTHFDCN
jgi:hypothetical protein